MRIRRGYSLVELMIVLSVGTAMLMVAVSVLTMLKQTQDRVRRRLISERRITRLAQQFRSDIHLAIRMERVPKEASSSKTGESDVSEAGGRTDSADRPAPPRAGLPVATECWQLAMAGGEAIRYEFGDGQVRRVHAKDARTTHEDYRLPTGVHAVLTPQEAGSTIALLRFEPEEVGVMGPRPICVEAVLGFDNRHASLAKGKDE